MAINTLTYILDFEFVFGSGTWTDMTSFLDPDSALQFSRGVDASRKMAASSLSFNFDNAGGEFTLNNPSSSYFNKLRKGIGVRFGWSYGGTPKYEFRGVLADVRPRYGGTAALNRAEFKCVGLTSLLREYKNYGMALQVGLDVDDVIAAIMTAVGSSHYSLADSALTIPYAFPRSDALTDIVAAAASDPGMLLFEDGQGRIRLVSMVGGNHASPTHTWGTTIVPEGDVSPDYRNDSQYARVAVDVSSYTPSSENVELYRHALNWESGFCDAIPPYTWKTIAGEFEATPQTVVTKFTQTIVPFTDSGDYLNVSMNASTTTLKTISGSQVFTPQTFRVGDEVRVEQEIMKVTALISSTNYMQQLTVERAQRGTLAVSHANIVNGAGVKLYRRTDLEVLTPVDSNGPVTLTQAISQNSSSFLARASTLAVNDFVKIDAEVMKITAIDTGIWRYSVSRAQAGTTAASHALGATVWRRTTQSPTAQLGASYIRASEFANGIPAESPSIVGSAAFANGQDIYWVGNKFKAQVFNDSQYWRYIAELVIGGSALKPNGRTATVAFEKAIPGILGVPNGPSFAMPYGAQSIYVAKSFAHGLLRSGRVPTPWLKGLTFTANQSENTVSMRSAEIGDLVRYTGTGTAREAVDEFYRIMGVSGRLGIDGQDILTLSFELAPSHLWRNPLQAYATDFQAASPYGVLNGGFTVSPEPPALVGDWSLRKDWENTGDWESFTYTEGGIQRTGLAMKVAAPVPATVNVGGASMAVGTHFRVVSTLGTPTCPANTGGFGVMFRGNSATPTAYWEARFNPTTSKIILWNTTDGMVSDVAWTATTDPEIEVKAQGNRIRVFVDCAAEPVLDVTSTRFNTNTYAGPAAEISTLTGRLAWIWRDFTAHGL